MQSPNLQPQLVHYLPIATTVLSAIFCVTLLRRYLIKGRGAHLLWWAGGIFFYGLGTALEGSITLWGNSVALNKVWYIAGALLGGYPLAQGTVYLLLPRPTANILSAITMSLILVFTLLVVVSPVHLEELHPLRPSGAILAWQWVRLCTPIINSYAVVFLVGGAVYSAIRYFRLEGTARRAIGNTFIAAGALLPAIGGGMTKWGFVEALYIGEFFGLVLIWIGYAFCVSQALDAKLVLPQQMATVPAGTTDEPSVIS